MSRKRWRQKTSICRHASHLPRGFLRSNSKASSSPTPAAHMYCFVWPLDAVIVKKNSVSFCVSSPQKVVSPTPNQTHPNQTHPTLSAFFPCIENPTRPGSCCDVLKPQIIQDKLTNTFGLLRLGKTGCPAGNPFWEHTWNQYRQGF